MLFDDMAGARLGGYVKQGHIKDLGDGLIIRRGRPEDAEELANLQGELNIGQGESSEGLRVWTLDLIRARLPGLDASHFTVVEDMNSGSIVSSLNLISQNWSYGGIEFGVGRIELVATRPDYRRRGLVREQMEVVHEWSAERGELIQAITGIPWYYRQFGYEMALENAGGRVGNAEGVPKLKKGAVETCRVRAASVDDLPFLEEVYSEGMKRYLVVCVRDQRMWRYELSGSSSKSSHKREIRIVEMETGERVGLLVHSTSLWGNRISMDAYELLPGVFWGDVTPSILRYLRRTGEEYAARENTERALQITFSLGTEHPAYQETGAMFDMTDRPYAWYLRIPDIVRFVTRVSPVLEERLAASAKAKYSGELKLSFVTDGLKILFDEGRIISVEPWMATQEDSRLEPRVRDGLFPPFTFLQILFGFRSVSDLEYAFPDCLITSQDTRVLLNILFPKRPSRVWGVG